MIIMGRDPLLGMWGYSISAHVVDRAHIALQNRQEAHHAKELMRRLTCSFFCIDDSHFHLIMSVRTASSTTQVLEDYKIHLTGSSSRVSSPNSSLNTSSHPVSITISSQTENPTNWPDNYRRVPAYRPADRNRDPAEIPLGRSAGDRVFITVMFMGVAFNSVSLLPLLRLLCYI
jgi:hypothetical protein